MTEVVLKGYFDRGKDEHVKQMNVNFLGDFVWFEFVLDEGRKVQTLCFRGEV